MSRIKNFIFSASFTPKINFPVYFVFKNKIWQKIPIFSRGLVILGKHLSLIRNHFFKVICNERIAETPLIISNINIPKAQILDVGSNESLMPLHLAAVGHAVTALDLNFYEYKHPNVTFLQGDICKVKLPKEQFDYVTFLSTLEHIGLGAYGEKQFERGDEQALRNVYSSLKTGGRLMISVPFGKKETSRTQRVYDLRDMLDITKQYTLEKSRFFIGVDQSFWQECQEKDLDEVSSYLFTQGMGFFVFRK